MTIAAYVPFDEFVANDPVLNHSSRVYDEGMKWFIDLLLDFSIMIHLGEVTITQPAAGVVLSVSDATIQDATASPATISLGANTLTYASTAVGTNTDMAVVISNTGDATLTISGLSSTGDFSALSFT